MPSWLVGLSAAGGEFFLRLGAREKAAAPHVTDRLHDDGRIIKSVFQTKHEERAWPHAVRERTNVHAVTGLASEAVIRAVDSIDTRCTVRVFKTLRGSAVTDRYVNLSNFLYVSRLVGWFGAPAGGEVLGIGVPPSFLRLPSPQIAISLQGTTVTSVLSPEQRAAWKIQVPPMYMDM